jgi:hypothetical protein
VTGANTTFGLALIPSAATQSLIAHATSQREPAVTVPVSQHVGLPEDRGLARFVGGK